MTRMQLAGIGVLGGVLTIIGAIGPWAKVGEPSFAGTDANRARRWRSRPASACCCWRWRDGRTCAGRRCSRPLRVSFPSGSRSGRWCRSRDSSTRRPRCRSAGGGASGWRRSARSCARRRLFHGRPRAGAKRRRRTSFWDDSELGKGESSGRTGSARTRNRSRRRRALAGLVAICGLRSDVVLVVRRHPRRALAHPRAARDSRARGRIVTGDRDYDLAYGAIGGIGFGIFLFLIRPCSRSTSGTSSILERGSGSARR